MVGAAEGVTFCAQGDSYEVIKTFFLIFLTILLSLVIQIPTYLGMNYFENNTVCKILIGLAAFTNEKATLFCITFIKCFSKQLIF